MTVCLSVGILPFTHHYVPWQKYALPEQSCLNRLLSIYIYPWLKRTP